MNRSPTEQKWHTRWISHLPLNLRGKLIVANMFITFIAILGMGYYVYYRAQDANNYLSSKLEQSVRKKAEEKLDSTINEQAMQLNSFFSARSKDVASVGATVERLLQQEISLQKGIYWDATQSLMRLPNGSWDNPNAEVASIFIPAKDNLTVALASELNTIKYTEASVPIILESNPEIIAIYFGGLAGETIYYPNIDLANIVPPDFDVKQRPWFINAAPAQNPKNQVVWSDPYQDAALHGLVVTSSVPVFEPESRFRGVAAMDIKLNSITELVSNIRVGTTGYAFLVDKDNRLIAFPPVGYSDFGITPEKLPLGEIINKEKLSGVPDGFFEILLKTSSGESGLATITLNNMERFMVYRPISEVGYGLVILVPTEELLTEAKTADEQIASETRNTIALSILLIIGILVVASVATLVMGNLLTSPLKTLTKTAEKITSGNLEARAEIQGRDEIAILAKALNTMTSTLSGLIQSLEQRVAERTVDLDNARLLSEKRVGELQTISEISGIFTGEQKIEVLLPLITHLVSERFDFYHVGIFLLDESRQFAVLQAANSEGGQKMLEHGHKLKVGTTGIVGFVAQKGESRIALDVGTDAVFFNNPDLPRTRSEMALPLITRGQTIGVLDVQSDKPGAFIENDASTLGILADQIAVVIENARLFNQTQQSLRETQALYSQHVMESWRNFAEEETVIGYQQSLTGGSKLNTAIDTDEIRQAMNRGSVLVIHPDGERALPEMIVPVKLRGQVIGVLKIKAPTKDRRWSQDEINLAEAVSDRLSLALENARLILDTQRQALKEQAISEVTARIGSSINLRNVLQTAVEELGRSIPGSEVVIKFDMEKENGSH